MQAQHNEARVGVLKDNCARILTEAAMSFDFIPDSALPLHAADTNPTTK